MDSCTVFKIKSAHLLVSFISWAVCVALGPEHPLDSQIQEEEEVL